MLPDKAMIDKFNSFGGFSSVRFVVPENPKAHQHELDYPLAGEIMMHSKDGAALDIRQTQNPGYTFNNIASKDWEVCEPCVLTAEEWKARNGGKHD